MMALAATVAMLTRTLTARLVREASSAIIATAVGSQYGTLTDSVGFYIVGERNLKF